ncbi:MAG: serpin family protein [Parvularculaceae bacterium]
MRLAEIIASAALAASGCATAGQSTPSLPSGGDPSSIAAANTQFGLELYKRIAADNDGDITISPASISAAFALAYPGARGETAKEIANVLHFAPESAEFRADMAAFLGLMSVEREKMNITTANSAWFDRRTIVEDEFVAAIKTAYGAKEKRVNFRTGADASREKINQWVEDRTNDRILDLLSADDVTDDTRFVLVNAIYFNGKWSSPFDVDATQKREFRSGGETLSVDMMARTGNYQVIDKGDFRAISIPYDDGAYSMAVFLPRADDGLAGFEAEMTPAAFKDWFGELDSARSREVALNLPKYQRRKSFKLKGELIAMGMPEAFSNMADFTGMVDPSKQPPGDSSVKIGNVVHQTFLKVDESGTEAAAATAIVGVRTTSLRPPPVPFNVNHPYFFVIRHNETGAVLFMGRVTDPTEA